LQRACHGLAPSLTSIDVAVLFTISPDTAVERVAIWQHAVGDPWFHCIELLGPYFGTFPAEIRQNLAGASPAAVRHGSRILSVT
jgi:hypothetical protein